MKPLAIDFLPRRPLPERARWLGGAAAVAMLLVTLAGAAWLMTVPVEASHMVPPVPPAPLASPVPPAPTGSEEAAAVDRAIRDLNLPWPAWFDALDAHFGAGHDALLVRAEADLPRASIRLSGEARSLAAVQALPAQLRTLPVVAGVTLLGQETSDNPAWPVNFSLELRLRETP